MTQNHGQRSDPQQLLPRPFSHTGLPPQLHSDTHIHTFITTTSFYCSSCYCYCWWFLSHKPINSNDRTDGREETATTTATITATITATTATTAHEYIQHEHYTRRAGAATTTKHRTKAIPSCLLASQCRGRSHSTQTTGQLRAVQIRYPLWQGQTVFSQRGKPPSTGHCRNLHGLVLEQVRQKVEEELDRVSDLVCGPFVPS